MCAAHALYRGGGRRRGGSADEAKCARLFIRFRRHVMQSLFILYLDRHHLGDALFLKSLAQYLASAQGERAPCLIVHGSGEKVERTLESQGHFPERTNGVLDVKGEDQRRLVERAVREMNQEIVATLTDEVVSTVGIQGVDRGLLQRTPEGGLQAPNTGWVTALLKQHVVPVVSALVEEEGNGHVQEVWGAEVVVTLAEALDASFDPTVCALTITDYPGLSEDGEVLDEASVNAVTDEEVPEPSAVQYVCSEGIPVLVTTLQGLFEGDEPRGTYVRG